jgi:hypothetical protein
MKEMVLRTVRRRSTEWGAALTVIGRPVVAGRGAAQHSIFRSRRIYASKRISDSLWPFGKAPFCFCGNLSGYSLLVFASAARGPKHAPASILVVVLGLSPGAVAGGHTGILHRMSGSRMVRYYVALYSATAAEQNARGKGATDADIEVARHCIQPEVAAQTTSAQLAR